MIVAQALEFINTEHVGEEPEDLHVSELDVILTFLEIRIVQRQYTVRYPDIAGLFRLILELDHANRYFAIDMHTLALIYIEELFTVAIGVCFVLLPIAQCYVFHHHVNLVV